MSIYSRKSAIIVSVLRRGDSIAMNIILSVDFAWEDFLAGGFCQGFGPAPVPLCLDDVLDFSLYSYGILSVMAKTI